MIDRFQGAHGERLLREALMSQKLVMNNADLADDLASVGKLREINAGETLISQGAYDNSIYFVIMGCARIVVNGRQVGTRGPNDHVGEMAAITKFLPRAASVIAETPVLVLELPEPEFKEVGAKFPEILERAARELAHRLMQRNSLIRNARSKPNVFIISSVEALDIARAIQLAFQHDPFSATVWTDGVFVASHYPLEDLEKAVDQCDFAIAVGQPDDLVTSRLVSAAAARDNVIFELGFFMGRLGRHRTFYLEPTKLGDRAKRPSDLAGINTIGYHIGDNSELPRNLGPACTQIRAIINELGPNN
jgi:CRP/FNR family transcriptional regulator, cyclic AMP receptor protein